MSTQEQEDHAYELQGKLAEAQEQINNLNETNEGLNERIDQMLKEDESKQILIEQLTERLSRCDDDLENYRTLVASLKKAANSALELLEEALASE